jgi:hypothetical protein
MNQLAKPKACCCGSQENTEGNDDVQLELKVKSEDNDTLKVIVTPVEMGSLPVYGLSRTSHVAELEQPLASELAPRDCQVVLPPGPTTVSTVGSLGFGIQASSAPFANQIARRL